MLGAALVLADPAQRLGLAVGGMGQAPAADTDLRLPAPVRPLDHRTLSESPVPRHDIPPSRLLARPVEAVFYQAQDDAHPCVRGSTRGLAASCPTHTGAAPPDDSLVPGAALAAGSL